MECKEVVRDVWCVIFVLLLCWVSCLCPSVACDECAPLSVLLFCNSTN